MNKQSLNQKLLQKLSPQQIKLMKLIQLSTLELEDRIDQEIELNPALEDKKEVEESLDFDTNNKNQEENDYEKRDIDIDQYISDDEIPAYKYIQITPIMQINRLKKFHLVEGKVYLKF